MRFAASSAFSGGETFLVSLALALGLSSLTASDTPIESLFIDEGFGMLDGATLDMVLATLDTLQATGCRIGIISHLPAVAERIGVRIHLKTGPGGSSRLVVLA